MCVLQKSWATVRAVTTTYSAFLFIHWRENMFIMRPNVNVITPRLASQPSNGMILRLAVTDVKLIYEDVNMSRK